MSQFGPTRNDPSRDPSVPANGEVPIGPSSDVAPLQALCVGLDCVHEVRLGSLLDEAGVAHDRVDLVDQALGTVVAKPFDLIVVSSTIGPENFAPLAGQVRRMSSSMRVLVAGGAPEPDELLAAMRAGATDWLDLSESSASILERLTVASRAVVEDRRRDERISRLKGICQKLAVNRDEFTRQMDALNDGLRDTVQDARGRADEAEVVGEFRGLLSQELDVEDLLRTALQYLLTKTGATNAAVFLHGSKPDQFGLGAYVHYDCPRTQAQPLLDRLGEEICERLAPRLDIIRFTDTREFVHSLGLAGAVLEDSELVAWSALHAGECMGVFFLFRNHAEPFLDEHAAMIDLLRPVFAAQMAKLVRIHHRSSFIFPKTEGGVEGDEDADEGSGEGWRDAA